MISASPNQSENQNVVVIIAQRAVVIFPTSIYMGMDCKPGQFTKDSCCACHIDSLLNQWKICLMCMSVELTLSIFSITLLVTMQMQSNCSSSVYWQVLSFMPMKQQ